MKRKIIIGLVAIGIALSVAGCGKTETQYIGCGYTPHEKTIIDTKTGEILDTFSNFDSVNLHWRRLALWQIEH